MEYLPLLGILIVVVGFALKWDALGIIVAAAIVTWVAALLPIRELFETIGRAFVANRNMANFLVIFPVVGLLEKNGLKETAAKLMHRIKKATPASVISAYSVLRAGLATFAVGLGGFPGFIRPVVYPMAAGSVTKDGKPLSEKEEESIKGMSSAIENIALFYGQAVFLGGGAWLLVANTLREAGYEVEPTRMLASHYPIMLMTLIITAFFFTRKSRKLMRNRLQPLDRSHVEPEIKSKEDK